MSFKLEQEVDELKWNTLTLQLLNNLLLINFFDEDYNKFISNKLEQQNIERKRPKWIIVQSREQSHVLLKDKKLKALRKLIIAKLRESNPKYIAKESDITVEEAYTGKGETTAWSIKLKTEALKTLKTLYQIQARRKTQIIWEKVKGDIRLWEQNNKMKLSWGS